MGALLAMMTAIAWGVNEWVVARAARTISIPVLGMWMSTFGLVVILPIAFVTGMPPNLGTSGLVSLFGPGLLAVGSGFVYWMALRIGKLAIVSPVVATSGAVAALLAVFLLGERFGPIGAVALFGAVAGVVLASYGGDSGSRAGMGLAAVAAVGFGAYTFALALASADIGPAWAVAGYRIAGIMVFLPVVMLRHLEWRLDREQRRLVMTATVLETVGFITLVMAFGLERVAIVSVIMAQFATVAVLLAATVLRERLRPHQWAGVGVVIVATSVLAGVR